MSDGCPNFVSGSATPITITETPQTLAEMGIVIDPATFRVRLVFEGLWQLKPIARYTRDPFTPTIITDEIGIPIFPLAVVCLEESNLLKVL